MTLATGARLGPYEILAPIGAGGMGEVWRARDPRLGRDVAIKVLPASFSADADRLRRFEQEARAAGILNHPNITAVLDIGEHDGAPYVVQELLEGDTLRHFLATGGLPSRKATEYGAQIAHGLAAAHEKGIVHRDLKPENLFVTRDGRVKILDFGLAKLTHTDDGSLATNLPTASAGTEPGVVLGTLGYMSPEQVRGQAADARSDIFAFGAILYEMLAGQRPFRGGSAADTMSAILTLDPPDISVTNQNVPLGLERIVRHCLEKSPEQRFQSARDLAFDLETLSGVSGSPAARAAEAATVERRSRFASTTVVAAAFATLAAGILAGRFVWKTGPGAPPRFHRLTYARGPIESARFAPDGHTVVYSASWDGALKPRLYSVRMESPESLPLSLAEGDVESISRSGEMLVLSLSAFSTGYAKTGTLAQAPLSSSARRDLLEEVGSADWSPDGSAMAVVRAPGWRYRLEYPVGKVLYETTGYISRPRVSPKGDTVAFFDHPTFGDDRGSVAIVDRAGKKTTLSTGWESEQGMAWSPSGDELWFTARAGGARSLYAVTPDGKQRTVATTPSGMFLQDISRDGRVLFIQTNARFGFLGLFDGDARERDLSGLEWSYGPRISEDGKTVVFTEQGNSGGPGYSVYLRQLDSSAPVRLGEGHALALSPDGKWVLAYLLRATPPSIVLLPTGAGEVKAFPRDSIDHSNDFGAFLPDGASIVFNGNQPGRPPRTFVQDLQGGAARPVSPEGVTAQLLSPDGKSLVVGTPEKGFSVLPLAGDPGYPIPGILTGDRPLRWTANGRFLFVGSNARELPAKVFRIEVSTGRRELWKELKPADPAGLMLLQPTAISADGKIVLFRFWRALAELYVAEGFK